MAARESDSLMMILSAIDLLLASVVAGVVLFICLGGAVAGNKGPAPAEDQSVMLVSVISPLIISGASLDSSGHLPAASIPNIQGVAHPVIEQTHSAPIPHWLSDPRMDRADELRMQTYMLDGSQDSLRFESLPSLAYVRIDLGSAGSIDIVANCNHEDWSFVWSLALQRFSEDTCSEGHEIVVEAHMPLLPRRAVVSTRALQSVGPGWTRVGQVGDSTLMASDSVKDSSDLASGDVDLTALVW